MFVDTHCHLNTIIKNEFDAPLPENFSQLVQPSLDEAQRHHVTRIINVGTSLTESINCVQLAHHFENMWATLGTHPNDLTTDWKSDIVAYKKILHSNNKGKIVGIGEIGLDYHYSDFDKQRQYDGFRAQIELGLEHDLPIIIHTRDAADETLHVIEEYKHHNLRGIIHCFSENAAFAQHARDLGFLLGIGGPLTYPKNQYLRDIFIETPLESIVLETDAPFLPPQYMRGKKNSPAQIAYIAQFLADLKGISLEEVGKITTENAVKLLRL
jgi:TatD DNase family protein